MNNDISREAKALIWAGIAVVIVIVGFLWYRMETWKMEGCGSPVLDSAYATYDRSGDSGNSTQHYIYRCDDGTKVESDLPPYMVRRMSK